MPSVEEHDYTLDNYYSSLFLLACPLPVLPENQNGPINMQISTGHGSTGWLHITPAQFIAIEKLLTANEHYIREVKMTDGTHIGTGTPEDLCLSLLGALIHARNCLTYAVEIINDSHLAGNHSLRPQFTEHLGNLDRKIDTISKQQR